MKPEDVFSSKADKYAQFRWSYAPQALETIFDVAAIDHESVVADIGAGTGILTGEFIGRVKQIFAVEPNPEMRAILAAELGHNLACHVIEGRAEMTELKGHSIDLITAAQAVQWFEPHQTKAEFIRILKPGGWLAICRNLGTDQEIGEALDAVFPAELDTSSLMIGKSQPRDHYFAKGAYKKYEFKFREQRTWDQFIGSLLTASYAPDPDSALYHRFEQEARRVFDRFSIGGMVELNGVTELYLGHMTM